MKQLFNFLGFTLFFFFASSANAVVDVTSITASILDAQFALIDVIDALIGLFVGLFAVMKIYQFLDKKNAEYGSDGWNARGDSYDRSFDEDRQNGVGAWAIADDEGKDMHLVHADDGVWEFREKE